MIIKGMITTNDGPVDIAELKAGHKILNQMHRAFAVSKVENMKASEGYTFEKNPNLIVTKGTVVKTMHGDKKVEELSGKEFYMAQPNMRMVKDKAVPLKKKYTAYKVIAEGAGSIFAANYSLEWEDSNA